MESLQSSSKCRITLPIKRPKITNFSSTEKYMVLNTYEHLRQNCQQQRFVKTNLAKKTAAILGIGIASVYRILKNYKQEGRATSPIETKKRPNIVEKINDAQKLEIKRKIHNMLCNGQSPSLNKVLKAINEDESLPNLRRSSLYRLMKYLQINFEKKPKNGNCESVLKRNNTDNGQNKTKISKVKKKL